MRQLSRVKGNTRSEESTRDERPELKARNALPLLAQGTQNKQQNQNKGQGYEVRYCSA